MSNPEVVAGPTSVGALMFINAPLRLMLTVDWNICRAAAWVLFPVVCGPGLPPPGPPSTRGLQLLKVMKINPQPRRQVRSR